MHPFARPVLACAGALLAAVTNVAAAVPDVTSALEWRLVGPFRAGWSTVVAGEGNGSDTFYSGAAGGGVWKTDDAGRTWRAVFDGVGSASVGALDVARSNHNVIYAGMGQVTSRYDITPGDGVYRSDDAGKTWRHVGLATSRHIGAIKVDPRNPDRAWVAALGSAFGPGGERGLYRTLDGGKTWQRTLFVSDDTGAVDVAIDPDDPNIVFASTWQVRYRPWLSYFTPDIGPESALYRSTDGGTTWQRISGGGWPAGPLGRIGLAVTHRAQGARVWAVIDAPADGGLYRSDDAGKTWLHVNSDPELINGYFSQITPAPDDPDTIFATGRGLHRCTAGGTQCDIVKGAPGGDDYHHLWIDPQRPERMITGADQGAVITVNGGRTWSSWYNQPTGQFYKVAVDNAFPYRIYGGQQDSGTVRISSRSDYGSISYRDWMPVGGDERDYQLADPRDADIVYSSGLGGRLSRWNARNGEVQNVTPWPVSSYGERPTDFQQRYSWITPIAISQLPPYPLYFGSQQLWRSTDQGATWEAISPDLSARKSSARNCDGNLDAVRARACGYGVIWNINPSPRDNSEIWIGTDDGLVRLTRDGGKTWADVTPKAVPAWAKVSTVEPSPTTPGTAYIAVDNHRQNDFRPWIFRTRDYGKTWTLAIGNLAPDHYVSVVRADTQQPGLLFAGTDIGVHVSFDDGANWQPLQRNLPTAWVRDLAVHGDDLIAGTQGRAIWVLDDVTPLRQAGALANAASVHLFKPAPAIRLRKNQNNDTPLPADEPVGRNPPTGAIIDYWLPVQADRVELEIRDGAGNLVRSFVSDAEPSKVAAERYFTADWIVPEPALQSSAGMHRFVWDLRQPRPRTTEFEYGIGTAYGAGVLAAPEGAIVAPGEYTVTLRVDGQAHATRLVVTADPRVGLDAQSLAAALDLYAETRELLAQHYAAAAELEFVGERISALEAKQPAAAVHTAIENFEAKVDALEHGAGDRPDDLNLESIGGLLRALATDIESSDRAPTAAQRKVLSEVRQRLDQASRLWRQARDAELPRLNAALTAAGSAPIVIPPLDDIRLSGPSVSREVP
jgi:photosystem II stability/assembly factor-like uncharacterized protein